MQTKTDTQTSVTPASQSNREPASSTIDNQSGQNNNPQPSGKHEDHRAKEQPHVDQGTHVSPLEPPPSEIVILTMGLTGVGKSTFIHAATGDTAVTVGHGLQSQTKNISTHTTTFPHPTSNAPLNFRIIDTPGFDDTSRSATDIFLTIVTFLADLAHSNVQIDGILYIHRISDDRMSGTSMRALDLFRALAGDAFMKKVVLLTSHWDRARPHDLALEREAELKADFWDKMLACGARTERFLRTTESAREVLLGFADRSVEISGENKLMAIQKEIVVDKLELPETEAGKLLLAKWDEAHSKTLDELAEVQEQLRQEKLKKDSSTKEDDDKTVQFVQELIDQELKLRKELSEAKKNQEKLQAVRRQEIEHLERMYQQRLAEAEQRGHGRGGFWGVLESFSLTVREFFGLR